MKSLSTIARDLAEGKTSSRNLVEQVLYRIRRADGEGVRAFLFVDEDDVLKQADRADQQRQDNRINSPLVCIPVSVKDLFDVKGQVTRAGSRILNNAPPATRDATVISRLRNAGLIIVGRTNMTEFAYSGSGSQSALSSHERPI